MKKIIKIIIWAILVVFAAILLIKIMQYKTAEYYNQKYNTINVTNEQE